jgi:hypothetical protein
LRQHGALQQLCRLMQAAHRRFHLATYPVLVVFHT